METHPALGRRYATTQTAPPASSGSTRLSPAFIPVNLETGSIKFAEKVGRTRLSSKSGSRYGTFRIANTCHEPFFLPVIGGHPVDDLRQGGLRAKAGQRVEFIDRGHAAHHVLEAGLVGFLVGNIMNGRVAASPLSDRFGQVLDRDFLCIANIDDLTDSVLEWNDLQKCFDSITDIAEAPRLLAVPEHIEWLISQCRLDEIRQNHAVAAGLPWAYRVKESHHDNRLLLLLPIGNRQKFVECFRSCITPPALCRGTKNQIGILVERYLRVLPIDFGCGGKDNEFPFLRGSLENELCAVDVGFNRGRGFRRSVSRQQ